MPRAALVRKPLPKPSPESDPRFRRVMDQLKAGAAKTKAHPPAAKKAADAAAAAKGPANGKVAGGKAKQVDKIQEAREGNPAYTPPVIRLSAPSPPARNRGGEGLSTKGRGKSSCRSRTQLTNKGIHNTARD